MIIMKEFNYQIKDKLGIHARPAGMLVKCAKACTSNITIAKNEKIVDATRLLAVMGMAVKQGETVKITVDGENEEQDFNKIQTFFKENL